MDIQDRQDGIGEAALPRWGFRCGQDAHAPLLLLRKSVRSADERLILGEWRF